MAAAELTAAVATAAAAVTAAAVMTITHDVRGCAGAAVGCRGKS